MRLRALGGLELQGSEFSRPKPLLLLAYLSLEGPQPRHDLAELFWLDAANPLASLSMALSQVRRAAPGVVTGDHTTVASAADCDARQLLDALDGGDLTAAVEDYTGPFLAGFRLPNWNAELEEWVLLTREYIAGNVRRVLLQLAEQAAAASDWTLAADHAQRAHALRSAAPAEPDELVRMHAVLQAADRPLARDVRQELEDLGVDRQSQLRVNRILQDYPERTGNLPVVRSPLVGRDRELRELIALLTRSGASLVTLTGTGGIGKTRLALAAAVRLHSGAFQDGAWFVPLVTVKPGSDLAQVILRAMDVPGEVNSDPLAALAGHIGSRKVLLLLDNFEHLPESAADLARLLAQCPGLKVLVTSRTRLNLQHEHVRPLTGLAYPADPEEPFESARSFPAVRLFEQVSQRTHQEFRLTEETAGHVIRICSLLEGLPLGIELSASWSHVLPLEEIVAELETSSDLPASQLQDLPDRHRSLRIAFDYSWRLLSDSERDALTRLAAFRGGFRADAARQVAGAGIADLAGLVDKSMLRTDATGRFSRHPLIRQFSHERLLEAPDSADEVRTRHQVYYTEFMEHWHDIAVTGELNRALTAIDQERANLDLAWNHMAVTGDLAAISRFTGPLSHYFDRRKRYGEGGSFMDSALAELPSGPATAAVRGKLLTRKAWFAYQSGQSAEAAEVAARALQELSSAGAVQDKCACLHVVAAIAFSAGDFREARQHWTEALELIVESGDSSNTGSYSVNIGMADHALGDLPAAQAHFETALAEARGSGDHYQVIFTLNHLGVLHLDRQDWAEAGRLLSEALGLARTHGLIDEIPRIRINLGIVAHETGDASRARELMLAARDQLDGAEDFNLLAFVTARLGKVAVTLQDAVGARQHFLEALLGGQEWLDIRLEVTSGLAELQLLHGRPGEAARLLQLLTRHPGVEVADRERYGRRLAGITAGDGVTPGNEPDPETALDDALRRFTESGPDR